MHIAYLLSKIAYFIHDCPPFVPNVIIFKVLNIN